LTLVSRKTVLGWGQKASQVEELRGKKSFTHKKRKNIYTENGKVWKMSKMAKFSSP
jgi:hypothetical protein